MWYNQSNALTAWRLGGTVVRRTAMTLAVMMLTAMTAWATTKTVTYTISYNSSTKYWLNGSDNTSFNIGSSIGMAKSYEMPMGDVTITITSAGDHCNISYYAKNESIDGFSYYDYTFKFVSSTYYITNVKIKDLVKRTELSVDNDTRECTVNWNHNQYKDAQQIEVTLNDTKPLFYYEINYELNGGTNAAGNPLSYEKSEGVASFAAATREGYTFGGWFDNSGCTGDAVTSIAAGSTGDKTLWAKWTANTYNVIFNANGGTGTMSNQTLTYDDAAQALSANSFTREGHNFSGWNTAANGSGTAYANGASVSNLATEQGATVNLYAQWTAIDYQVTFDANGHGTAPSAQTVTYGTKATEPTALTADGWIFGGWYRESSCVNRWEFGADNVMGTTTLYAKWDQDVFTITYVLDGGVNSASNPLIYKKSSGETITLAAPTKTGYTFKGWTPDNGVISSGSEGNKTFTATWQINQYTITFDTDGGTIMSGSVGASITQDYGTPVTAPTAVLAKQGYLFNRWAIPATMPAENITVRPDWTELAHHNRVEPTCIKKGTIEYYYGNTQFWKENDDHLTYTTINQFYDLPIPELGHTWGTTPQWEWRINYMGELEAIVKLVCTRCGYRGHTISHDGDITSEVTTAPTETTDGVMTYTAKIKPYDNTPEYTDTYQEAIPRLYKVAKIGSTEYSYLKDAIEHATSGDVITLLGDVVEPNTYCTVPHDYSIKIDLNGHSVLIDKIITMGDLTVKNGSLVCNIDNANGGNGNTLTLDNANLTCVGVYDSDLDSWSSGIQWLATDIAVTNGSEMYIYGGTTLGYGSETFTLTIDGTSSVVLENATFSSYNMTRVKEQLEQYMPTGYTIEVNGENGTVMYGGSEYTGSVTLSPTILTLADDTDNSDIITANNGYEKDVTLSGRTLYKDDKWNTICLPFDVTLSGSVLDGAEAHTLASASLSEAGALTLDFGSTAETKLLAGKPYIIKWASGSALKNPVFNGVTITSTAPTPVTSNNITFVGQYDLFSIVASGASGTNEGNLNEIILLGGDNTLGYASEPRTLHPFRAHFMVPVGNGVGVKAYQISFGEGNETGIISIDNGRWTMDNEAGAWYDLSGRKLDGKPAQKGVYINNGRKVIIE